MMCAYVNYRVENHSITRCAVNSTESEVDWVTISLFPVHIGHIKSFVGFGSFPSCRYLRPGTCCSCYRPLKTKWRLLGAFPPADTPCPCVDHTLRIQARLLHRAKRRSSPPCWRWRCKRTVQSSP